MTKGIFIINSAFRVSGKGMVFSGNLVEGKIRIGDKLRFDFEGKHLEREIIGLDYGDIQTLERSPRAILIRITGAEESDAIKNNLPQNTIGYIC